MPTPDEHKPIDRDWKVVSSDATSVTVLAMCQCGDDDCAFVTTASIRDMVHMPSRYRKGT
jgi:hypothetical protein